MITSNIYYRSLLERNDPPTYTHIYDEDEHVKELQIILYFHFLT